MQEVFLNLFPVEVKPKKLLVYEIVKTEPETLNREVRFRLAAVIAKHISSSAGPVFSVGDRIYSLQEVPTVHCEKLDLEGTAVEFRVTVKKSEEVDLERIPEGPERLVNRLVDWYYKERVPGSFRMGNVNYRAENLFARFEARLYRSFRVNVNEGMRRATRIFGGRRYLLLDPDYRVTYERDLWEEVREYIKRVLNGDEYMPDQGIIRAINERYGRTAGRRGMRVQGKNRIGEYEIIEFDYTKNPDTPGTAGEMSQTEYFLKVYGIRIKDRKQPLVRVRVLSGYYRGKEMYHVPELLVFDRMPPRLRENKKLMSALTNITKPEPRGRFSQILGFIQGDPFGRTSGFADDDFVKNFIDVSRNPVCVQASVLPAIRVRMGDAEFSVSSDSEFLKKIQGQRFHRVPEIRTIVLVYNASREKEVLEFYSMLAKVAGDHGMKLPEPVKASVEEDYADALAKGADADIVLTFASRENHQLYERIKQDLLVKYGTLSQNITYENTLDVIDEYRARRNERAIRTVLTLLSMQICAKLGGAPWAFSEPVYERDFPVIGLDIHYRGDWGEGTVGACAVFDPYGEYLFSDISLEENGSDLETLLSEVLDRYIQQFGDPAGLLILRDGLNFTQEQRFLYGPSGELEAIERVLSNYGISRFILVMEKKGSLLRMYKKMDSLKVENPEPGTVVIGSPFESNEMLMISQETYQGTVEPVMYRVIRPQNPDMDGIATAVYKLTRHHWNTYRSLRIPAPAFHADRIAYLVRRILRRKPKTMRVLNRPFYL